MELELAVAPIILLISRWNYGIAVETTSIHMICFFSFNICITMLLRRGIFLITQLAFSHLKLTIEILEQGVKYVQS